MKIKFVFIILLIKMNLYSQQDLFNYSYGTQEDEIFISLIEEQSHIYIVGIQFNSDQLHQASTCLHILDINGILLDTIRLTNYSENIIINRFLKDNNRWIAFGTQKLDTGYNNTILVFDSLLNRITKKSYYKDKNVEIRSVQDVLRSDSVYYIINYDKRATPFPYFSVLKINNDLDSLGYFSSVPYTGIAYRGLKNKFDANFRVFTFTYYIPTWGQSVYFDKNLNIIRVDSLPHILHQFNDALWVTDTSYLVTGITVNADSIYQPNKYDDDIALYVIDTNNRVTNYYFQYRLGSKDFPGWDKNIINIGNNYYYVGTINRVANPSLDTSFVVINKLDSNFNLVWEKKLGEGTKNMDINGVYPLSDGNILLLIWEFENHLDFTRDAFAIKMSPDGEILFTTPIYKHKFHSIKAYPNPAIEYIKLDFFNQGSIIRILKIYDISGQKVLSMSNVNPSTQIDVSSMLSGVYIIECYSESGDRFIGKFVKE